MQIQLGKILIDKFVPDHTPVLVYGYKYYTHYTDFSMPYFHNHRSVGLTLTVL